MKSVFWTLSTLTLLAGCDAAQEAMDGVAREQQPMTLVFQPGYKMQVGGKPATIFGTAECPKADKFMKALFGPAPDEGQRECVVIAPDAEFVDVIVGFPDGPVQETWTVERDGNRTMLFRADGGYVTESK